MPNQIDPHNSPDYDEDEIRLIDLIYPIYKRRRFLILFCFVVVIAVAAITVIMPKTYEATGVILPETKETGVGEELKAAFLEQFGWPASCPLEELRPRCSKPSSRARSWPGLCCTGTTTSAPTG
jgi:hypothetical protein